MGTVLKHIKSLLQANDCVVIPGFGGLVANPQSATFNKLNNQFAPPFKALGFNMRLVKNDGLLTHEISIQENIDYNDAVQLVADFVTQINSTIQNDGRYDLSDIGTFYTDTNKNLRFKQNIKLDLDTNFFGLQSIKIQPLEQKVEKVEPAVVPNVETDQKEVPVVSINEANNSYETEKISWKRIAIAACTIPFMFYVFWLGTYSNIFNNQNNFQYSDLNPFVEKVCITFSPRNEAATLYALPEQSISTIELAAEIGNENFIQHSFLSEKDKDIHTKQDITIQLKKFAPTLSTRVATNENLFAPRNDSGFFIITGCFEFYENAVNYVSQLRGNGYSAQIVDQKNGLFRVSSERVNSREQALTKLNSIKSSGYSGAWILSK